MRSQLDEFILYVVAIALIALAIYGLTGYRVSKAEVALVAAGMALFRTCRKDNGTW